MAAGDHPPSYDSQFFRRRSYNVCKKQASSSWKPLILSSHPSKSDFLYTLCYKIPGLLCFHPINKKKSLDYKWVYNYIVWSIMIKVREFVLVHVNIFVLRELFQTQMTCFEEAELRDVWNEPVWSQWRFDDYVV